MPPGVRTCWPAIAAVFTAVAQARSVAAACTRSARDHVNQQLGEKSALSGDEGR